MAEIVPLRPLESWQAMDLAEQMSSDQDTQIRLAAEMMVDRFLGWRLPNPWNPDNGISYQRPNYAHEPADHDWPTGTNLFDAQQATEMVRYMLEGLPDWLSHE